MLIQSLFSELYSFKRIEQFLQTHASCNVFLIEKNNKDSNKSDDKFEFYDKLNQTFAANVNLSLHLVKSVYQAIEFILNYSVLFSFYKRLSFLKIIMLFLRKRLPMNSNSMSNKTSL